MPFDRAGTIALFLCTCGKTIPRAALRKAVVGKPSCRTYRGMSCSCGNRVEPDEVKKIMDYIYEDAMDRKMERESPCEGPWGDEA